MVMVITTHDLAATRIHSSPTCIGTVGYTIIIISIMIEIQLRNTLFQS